MDRTHLYTRQRTKGALYEEQPSVQLRAVFFRIRRSHVLNRLMGTR